MRSGYIVCHAEFVVRASAIWSWAPSVGCFAGREVTERACSSGVIVVIAVILEVSAFEPP